VSTKVQDFQKIAGAVTTAAGSATSDVANVAGTAGELFKRSVQGLFGVYTTKEGIAKAQARARRPPGRAQRSLRLRAWPGPG
jgi:hypothetical protein